MTTITTKSNFGKFKVAVFVILVFFCYHSRAQLSFQVKTNHYFISGSTQKEIMDSIVSNRPWGTNLNFLAFTKWTVNWEFQTALENQKFRPVNVKVRVVSEITMPAYKPPTNGISQDFLINWGNYYRKLLEHELGHVSISQEAGKAVYERLTKYGGAASRREMHAEVHRIANSTIDEYRKKDEEYDKTTRHGLNQITTRF